MFMVSGCHFDISPALGVCALHLAAKATAAATLTGEVAVSTLHVPGWYGRLCHTTRPAELHKPGRKKGELGRRTAKEENVV